MLKIFICDWLLSYQIMLNIKKKLLRFAGFYDLAQGLYGQIVNTLLLYYPIRKLVLPINTG